MATRMDVAIVEVPVGERSVAGWPVAWGPVWAGALAGVTSTLLGGLIAVGAGAFDVTPGSRIGPEDLGFAELAASVCVAFFAFVIAGWVAARLAGHQRAEPAMIHGAIAWLIAVPLVLVLIAFGARGAFGGFYAGLGGAAIWASPGTPVAAEAAREAAGGAATALLLGLMGAVLGGWFGSGEPMSFTYYRSRRP